MRRRTGSLLPRDVAAALGSRTDRSSVHRAGAAQAPRGATVLIAQAGRASNRTRTTAGCPGVARYTNVPIRATQRVTFEDGLDDKVGAPAALAISFKLRRCDTRQVVPGYLAMHVVVWGAQSNVFPR